MPRKFKNNRRPVDDILHSLHELAQAIEEGTPLEHRFTVRTVQIPQPGKYSPTAVKRLRAELGMSQAVFAELLGVSRVWVQGWERGVRRPTPLARRLLDTVRANPASWLATISAKAG
ncbi:MAG TPA: helix-turn-helix domain-containing protein [Tepidisphaeraceae bacterium]|jgi:DNA-binding transcriptional regulator YiaG